MANPGAHEKETVLLMVRSQGNEEIHFRIRLDTPLRKLMEKYIQRIGVASLSQVNFLFNGNRILPRDQPGKLHMKDGDEIAMVWQQLGGGP